MTCRTLFLFGSWVSPAPKVKALTDAVLDEPMYQSTSGLFLPGTNPLELLPNHEVDLSRLVPRLLRRIRSDFARYQDRKPIDITYEDIAFVCSQFYREWESGMVASPAVGAYYEDLEKAFLSELPSWKSSRDAFSELVRGAIEWLKAVVAMKLCSDESPTALAAFVHRFPPRPETTVIATLNHDLFLEKVLGESTNLGFVGASPLPRFDPAHLHGEHGVRLIKLHGSIDWFWAYRAQTYVRQVGPASGEEFSSPIMLVGNTNKLEDYTRDVFPHLFHAFQNELYRCSRIVVSGYGFKDGGVNRRLIDWLHSRQGVKMLVIHPTSKALQEDAFVPYSARRMFGNCDVIGADDSPNAFRDGVTLLQTPFENVAKSPFAEQIEMFFVA